MLKVTVKRSQWFRGQGPALSQLLLPRYKRHPKLCCLGFAMLAAGYKKETIAGKASPAAVLAGKRRLRAGIKKLLVKTGRFWANGVNCGELMRVNDSCNDDDATREVKIRNIGLRVGIEFTFVD